MATWNLKKQANAENIPALFRKCKKKPNKNKVKIPEADENGEKQKQEKINA